MKLIYNSVFLEHDIIHPENKERLSLFSGVKETEIEDGSRYLELVHTRRLIERGWPVDHVQAILLLVILGHADLKTTSASVNRRPRR